MEELGLSSHAVGRILDLSQMSVWRHYKSKRRLSADSMEMYNARLGIFLQDMRKWNKVLKERWRIEDEQQDKSGEDG